jgi:hypothetical protein
MLPVGQNLLDPIEYVGCADVSDLSDALQN